MEFHSAVKKSEIMTFSGKWIRLEIINVKQTKSDTEKQIPHFLSYVETRFKYTYVCTHIHTCVYDAKV